MTSTAAGVDYSVLIARAGLEDRGRILETLAALRAQDCAFSFEVIVVDRVGDDITAAIESGPGGVRLLRCHRAMTMPAMRTKALHAAAGRVVAITEDHCLPCPGWLRSFAATFQRHPGVTAVGGPVANGLAETRFDWATYLCEYASFAPPLADGRRAALPGMNIAYLRSALLSVPASALTSGFWETTVHPAMLAAGAVFAVSSEAWVSHCKRFSLRWFLTQRFAYSRYYAGIRFAPGRVPTRLTAALLCPLLPILLALRLATVVRHKPEIRAPAMHALPWLMLFHLAWAAGECAGYLFGPAEALLKIE